MSPRVSRPDQPTASQNAAGSGSVTTIDEFIGSQDRRSPRSAEVKPSVARSTNFADTVPRSVTALASTPGPPGTLRCPGRMAVTVVDSYTDTPIASTTRASP